MTRMQMRWALLDVQEEVTDRDTRTALGLAANLIVGKLTPMRIVWLVMMLRDMSHGCKWPGQSKCANSLKRVVTAISAD